MSEAALSSWALDGRVIALLLLTAGIYVRGWLRNRREVSHLACFLGGLFALWLALESPLDALDALFLSAHMTQHLLLIMIAPPLLVILILLAHRKANPKSPLAAKPKPPTRSEDPMSLLR